MDTLDALRLFVSIAETGSMSAAARLESVAQSTVTVALRELEKLAGATLITRTTRRLSFTHEGRQFVSNARRILADWDAAIADARNGPLRGPIKITAPQELGRVELVPIVDRFLLKNPAVTIALHFADNVLDLVDNDIDLALRHGPLVDSTFKARLLLRSKRVVCASPDYWNKRGYPKQPDDLSDHNCLVHSRPDAPFAAWPFLYGGEQVSVRVRGDRIANDTLILRDWALAGLGVIRRDTFGIRRELASGSLVTALDAYSIREANLYAITTGGMLSQRVSAFMEFLEHELVSTEPALP